MKTNQFINIHGAFIFTFEEQKEKHRKNFFIVSTKKFDLRIWIVSDI